MKLYHHVQYLEQRMIMLETFCLQLALHLNHKGSAARPPLPGYTKPQYRPPQSPRREEIMSYEERHNEAQLQSTEDADFASLAASMEGADETSVSEFGTTDYGDDPSAAADFGSDLGDPGDAAADAGDTSGDAGSNGGSADGGDAGGGDAGGMD